jgi:Cu/Ag efflux pump CusA
MGAARAGARAPGRDGGAGAASGRRIPAGFPRGAFRAPDLDRSRHLTARDAPAGRTISAELLGNPHIATVEEQIGRAEAGEDPWGPHRSEFHVELKPLSGGEEEGVQQEIRDTLAKFPGITSEVLTFLGDRIGETISGETAAVVVSVYGDDLEVLDAKAREVAQLLNSLPGHADVLLKSPPGMPRLTGAAAAGTPAAVWLHAGRGDGRFGDGLAGHGGVAQIYEAQQVHDVVVILEPAQRAEPETAGALLVQNAGGTRLPLRELADVDLTEGRASISHDGARRRQTVTCNVEGRDVASFVAEAKQRVAAEVKFPGGAYAVFTGAAEQARAGRRELLLHSAFAGVGIVLLLRSCSRTGATCCWCWRICPLPSWAAWWPSSSMNGCCRSVRSWAS